MRASISAPPARWCARPRSRPECFRSAASGCAPSPAGIMPSPTGGRAWLSRAGAAGEGRDLAARRSRRAYFQGAVGPSRPVRRQIRAVVRHADQRQRKPASQRHSRPADQRGPAWLSTDRPTAVPGQPRPRRPPAQKAEGGRHRPHHRRQHRALGQRRGVRDHLPDRRRAAGCGRPRQRQRHRPRRAGCGARLQAVARHGSIRAQKTAAPRRRCDRGARRRHRGAGMHRYRPGPSLHGRPRSAPRKISLLRRPLHRGRDEAEHAERGALEFLTRVPIVRSASSRRGHAVHASTWNRPALAAWLNIVHKPGGWSPPADRSRLVKRPAFRWRAQHRARHWREAGKALTQHPAIKATLCRRDPPAPPSWRRARHHWGCISNSAAIGDRVRRRRSDRALTRWCS